MVSVYMKGYSSLACKTNVNCWLKLKYFSYHNNIVRYHHWKIVLVSIGLLALCWLGFKSMVFERNLMDLWIYNSSRLHNETSYISQTAGNQLDTGSIETVLQVSMDNLLSTEYLLEHLQLLQLIINLTLRYDGRTFTLAHFCQKVDFPKMHYIDTDTRAYIESFMPCKIITPLNCFWEGSKISLSKEEGVKIDWKYFNIKKIVLNSFQDSWLYQFFQDLFKEAGIGSGFVSKPCIDKTDPFCPNKQQKNIRYESIINEGCYQIAENLYKYSKSVFLGKNNRGLQSLLLLRSSADVLQTMKINELDWTESRVQHVINLWLQELRKTVVKYNKQRPYLQSLLYKNSRYQSQRIRKSSFYVFTTNSLNSAFNQASHDETLLAKYCISSCVVMLFMIVIFVSSGNLVRSHCWLAISSTALLGAAIVSGIGLTAAAGFTFSALTTQVVPFLMIGLGLDEVVILTERYTKTIDMHRLKKNGAHPVGQTLFDCATLLMCSFLVKMLILSAATFIPVPLMRSFCIQILFITLLQTAINTFLYPCLLYLDSVRREHNRVDLLCCLLKRQAPREDTERPSSSQSIPLQYDRVPKQTDIMRSRVIFSTEFTTSPDTLIPNNVHQYCEINPIDVPSPPEYFSPKSFPQPATRKNTFEEKIVKTKKHRCCWKFHYRISRTFLHIIVLVPVQITVILITILIIVMGFYSAINLDCGVILNSIFARDSNEYNYIEYESKAFRMQTFDILTKELDYVYQQDSLLQLHEEIKELPHVEMLENGKFWLSSLILWLQDIQKDFDRDVRNHLILLNGTWLKNASKNGLLAMTMMVQDGHSINYKQLQTSRLIRAQRIDESKFYMFLNVWRSVSVEFDSLPCLLFPKLVPFNMDNFIPNQDRSEPLIIRMTSLNLYTENPLQFVSCKYFYKGPSQRDELAFVKTVRTITSRYSDRGVPAIPIGNIFSLSEQYLHLRYQLMMVTIVLAVGMFVISLLAINHFLASVLATLLLTSSLLSPMLFMNLYQIPLNATSGVMALWSGGLGFRFSLFLIVSYVEQSEIQQTPNKTSNLTTLNNYQYRYGCSNIKLGDENDKQMKLKRAFEDVQCGKAVFSSFLGMAFILMSDITFLWQHFLLLPLIGVLHSLLNYYCLAPIFCLYLIPKSKTPKLFKVPLPKSDPVRPKSRSSHRRSTSSFRAPHRSHSAARPDGSRFDNKDPSSIHGKLSIIPEESTSVRSSTKSSTSHDDQNIGNDSSCNSSHSQEGHPHFMEQNIESSVTIHYASDQPQTKFPKDGNNPPELAVKTYFKYRQPLGQDQ